VLDHAASRRREGQVLVALAALAWSSAGVLQRRLDLDAATQIAGRAVFAALALLLFVAVMERGHVVQATRAIGWAGVGFALCMATASGSFIAAQLYESLRAEREHFDREIAAGQFGGLFEWLRMNVHGRGASVGAYHRGRGYPRGLCKEVPVFSRLRETCRLKILQVNGLAAESFQERTYESPGGQSHRRSSECNRGEETNPFDGPISRAGRVQLAQECSICIVRVGREIPCKAGVVLLLL